MPVLHAVVHGMVQGVSFRYYAQLEAIRLGLRGWVRNMPDQTVEVLAIGSQEVLSQFEVWLRRGSPAARVERVDTEWTDDEYHIEGADNIGTGFHIRYADQ